VLKVNICKETRGRLKKDSVQLFGYVTDICG